jgi:hypothetical protein
VRAREAWIVSVGLIFIRSRGSAFIRVYRRPFVFFCLVDIPEGLVDRGSLTDSLRRLKSFCWPPMNADAEAIDDQDAARALCTES